MKRIDAVVRQGSLDEVQERLTNLGAEGLTPQRGDWLPPAKGPRGILLGIEYKVDFHPKLMLPIVARRGQVEEILGPFSEGAYRKNRSR
jgi:nitrogen regulatory protein PII